MATIDTDSLERDGFVVLPALVSPDHLAEFEAAIARFAEIETRRLGPVDDHPEPFIALFRRGGAYTKRLYSLLEDLFVLHRMGVAVGQVLEASGFLAWAEVEVPLVWPDLRVDVPNDVARSLPVHQDYASTRCHRAWRLWVPLRPSDSRSGTMIVYPGTHKAGPVPHNSEDPLTPFVEAHHYAGLDPVVFDLPAGDGVLMSPLTLHGSVTNRSERTKFTLLVQVQDLATFVDPDDGDDALARFESIARARAGARAEAGL